MVNAPEELFIETDSKRVRQVLDNLISNAVKYGAEGKVTLTVETKSGGPEARGGEWVALSVADIGPGIPKEKHEQVFQEFTRLDPDAPHGAGVGLAISRRIARLLGGDITLSSELGRGSTFTLWLPARGARRAIRKRDRTLQHCWPTLMTIRERGGFVAPRTT